MLNLCMTVPFEIYIQRLRCCATNRMVAGSIPAGVSRFFIDIISFRSHYGPGVYSACNRNEHQLHFLGGGRCVRLAILPPSCAVVMKSWNLNFLEPSGPLQTCNGTDFFNGKVAPVNLFDRLNLLAPELFFF